MGMMGMMGMKSGAVRVLREQPGRLRVSGPGEAPSSRSERVKVAAQSSPLLIQ